MPALTRHRKNGSNVAELVADGTVRLLKLEEFLPYRLAVLSSVVSRVIAEVAARHDLKLSEWVVLMRLGESGQTTAKVIGARNRMHKTKVSRAVAVLMGRGLIGREPNHVDLRQSFFSLTPLGKRLYDEYAPMAADVARRLEDAVPEADRLALEKGLINLTVRSQQLISAPEARKDGVAPRPQVES